ncbi:DNA-binding transcriptional regulator, LysR family [Verrucomicrobium sp. GAS474]|uniref:LysR family transcriptional regulator n=1 Tax=Verrucomicrobium sp. GAS474 TaxID=1882831 RepID=UPI00087CE6AF|nr:LysR family transcriptional regulator [Verrucomicrobium sp. GAS474]SDT90032.1 DNA-binding transcriptional regulator, LysR family [Verrucomicrobium sp. GAS474]
MNLHHLELFYYVAKAGGISRACAVIPYGVQQPAVSAQILTLEKELGLVLFQRKPFHLTPAGGRLFAEIAPFFERVADLGPVLRGEFSHQLRLVALGEVLKDHMPELLQALMRRFPGLKARLYERNQAEAIALLDEGEADLAVTVRETSLPERFASRDLIRLPMVLLVPPSFARVKRAEAFWTGEARAPLVALPGNEILTRHFAAELLRRGASWPTAIEANGVELVANYVSHGMGVGLSVRVPQAKLPPGVRVLPLKDFPDIVVAAFWRGTLREPSVTFLDLLTKRAEVFSRRIARR